jgi:glycine hydroxymethyltransferase
MIHHHHGGNMSEMVLAAFARQGVERLSHDDPVLYELLEAEYYRQTHTLAMVAASSIADPSVFACEGMVPANVTAEGYPGKRFHAGCLIVDKIEQLAIDRARAAFKAQYANVQPHSATTANEIVMSSVLKPGDTILGLELECGGHLTHGARASFSGQYFHAIGYGLDEQGLIDYEQVAMLAHRFKPKLIICGATAYPRFIDFQRFRSIADDSGALLLADISHTAGLIVAGLHPSPIDHAHFTTTCTHKQLYGPRGGLILLGRDYNSPAPDGKRTLAELMQRAVFPFFQGAPILNAIAAKARALALVMTPEFHSVVERIITDASALARSCIEHGYRVVSGGTDNHIVLLDVTTRGITGIIAQQALEECHITVNKNRIPGDQKSALITSGIRLGTNSLAFRGMEASEMQQCAGLMDRVLTAVEAHGEREYHLDRSLKEAVHRDVERLCQRFPIPHYPLL